MPSLTAGFSILHRAVRACKRVCALAFPQNADAMHRPSEGETAGNCKNAAERSLQFPLFDERMRMQCTASRTARVQIFSHAPFSGIQKDAASLQRPYCLFVLLLQQAIIR